MAAIEIIQNLKLEILDRCEDDLVRFLEIDSVAREAGLSSQVERHMLIADVIASLVDSGDIEVGDAVNIGNFVEFRAWPEKGHPLAERLRAVTSDFVSSELGEGFWLAKPETA